MALRRTRGGSAVFGAFATMLFFDAGMVQAQISLNPLTSDLGLNAPAVALGTNVEVTFNASFGTYQVEKAGSTLEFWVEHHQPQITGMSNAHTIDPSGSVLSALLPNSNYGTTSYFSDSNSDGFIITYNANAVNHTFGNVSGAVYNSTYELPSDGYFNFYPVLVTNLGNQSLDGTFFLNTVTLQASANGVICSPLAPAAVPEPSTWALWSIGLAGLSIAVYRRRQCAFNG